MVDGQVGPGTRAAIERYQAVMGYPVDGAAFADPQFEFLVSAHEWATTGGGAAQTGLGGVPLLMAYQQQVAMQQPAPVQPSPVQPAPVQPTQAATPVQSSSSVPAPVLVPTPAPAPTNTLPTFVITQ